MSVAFMTSPVFAARAEMATTDCAAKQNCDIIKFPSSDLRRFQPGDRVFSEGETSTELFEILQGVVMVLRDLTGERRQILKIARAGSFIGLTAHETHDCSAIALTNTLLYRQPRGDMRGGPHYGAPITGALFHEIHQLRDLALSLGRKTAIERLAAFLISLLDDEVHAPVDMTLPVSRPEIADHLGLALETVSRNFTHLKVKGLISIRSNARVTILDLVALRKVANDG